MDEQWYHIVVVIFFNILCTLSEDEHICAWCGYFPIIYHFKILFVLGALNFPYILYIYFLSTCSLDCSVLQYNI